MARNDQPLHLQASIMITIIINTTMIIRFKSPDLSDSPS
jgi:hypothetical protein